MNERRRIVSPNRTREHDGTKPHRAQSILPTSLPSPKADSPAIDTPKICDTPAASSEPYTQNRRKRTRFEQRYTRVTTYIVNDLHQQIMDLRDNELIESITALVNAAISSYIAANYRRTTK